jgi:hypothetical protein
VRAFLGRHPLYPLRVAWGNTLRLLELGGAKRTRFGAVTIDVSPRAAIWGARELWVVCALALAGLAGGLWRRASSRRWRPPGGALGPAGWLLAVAAVLWVFTALIQSETPRFRAPLDPFLLIAGAVGLATLSRAAARRRVAAGGAAR